MGLRGPKKGERKGGRQKGTPNKRTLFSVKERLEELGVDLVGEILRCIRMVDEPDSKASLYLRLLEYCDAKRKAVEVSGSLNTPEQEKIKNMPMSELTELVKESLPKDAK